MGNVKIKPILLNWMQSIGCTEEEITIITVSSESQVSSWGEFPLDMRVRDLLEVDANHILAVVDSLIEREIIVKPAHSGLYHANISVEERQHWENALAGPKVKSPVVLDLRPHFLYIVQSRSFYKVGIAANVESRVKGMSTSNPHGIKLIDWFEFQKWNCRKIEQHAHDILSKFKVHGEWFDCDLWQVEEAIDLARKAIGESQ